MCQLKCYALINCCLLVACEALAHHMRCLQAALPGVLLRALLWRSGAVESPRRSEDDTAHPESALAGERHMTASPPPTAKFLQGQGVPLSPPRFVRRPLLVSVFCIIMAACSGAEKGRRTARVARDGKGLGPTKAELRACVRASMPQVRASRH